MTASGSPPNRRPAVRHAATLAGERPTRTFGALFLAGPLLAEAWLLLPHSNASDDTAILVVALGTQLIGLCLLAGLLDRVPTAVAGAIGPVGTILISAAYFFTHDPRSGFGLFYLWTTPYALMFSSRRHGVLQLAFAAASCAVTLALIGPGGDHTRDERLGHGLLVVGTLVTVGILVRRLSEALRTTEARNRRMIESLPVITYVADPGPEGRWRYVSPQVRDILGDSPEEWLGDPRLWIERVHPDDRERVLALQEESARTGTAFDTEYRIFARDGSLVWLRDQATPVRDADGRVAFDGILDDVTARRRAEYARAAVIASALDGIVTIDHRGDVIEFNPAAERIFGYASSEIVGKQLGDLVVPLRFRDAHRAGVARAVAGEPLRVPGQRMRVTARRADGTEIPVEVTILRIDDDPPRLTGFVRDLTEAERAEQRARRSQAMLAKAEELADVGSWQWDLVSGEFTWSDGLYRLYRVDPDTFEPSFDGMLAFAHPDERETLRAAVAEAVATGRPWTMQRRVIVAGSLRYLHARGEPQLDDAGRVVRLFGFQQDVTERRRAELALAGSHAQMQAIIDGSPSVIYVKDRDHRYLMTNRRLDELWGLEPGGAVGKTDKELAPADSIETLRAHDRRVLSEGEVVIEEQVIGVAGRQRVFLTQKFPLRGEDGSIYAVGGVSTDITERKQRERELRDEVEWSNRIRRALASDGLVLHAQPIVDTHSGRLCQEELLVRMRDEEDRERIIAPALFLPAAERTGLVTEIDRWVVTRAIELATGRKVEANLSGRSIGDPALLALIEDQLRHKDVAPGNVVFEITETTVIGELHEARTFARRLNELGCGFALDDFGTGFGSFSYLKHFPVDYIKIDIEFVRDLGADPANRRLIRAIVGVASGFGIQTIAEGVEDEEALDVLRELGVDYVQGYLLGRPSAVDGRWAGS